MGFRSFPFSCSVLLLVGFLRSGRLKFFFLLVFLGLSWSRFVACRARGFRGSACGVNTGWLGENGFCEKKFVWFLRFFTSLSLSPMKFFFRAIFRFDFHSFLSMFFQVP